jgi:hypothetical protein
VLKNVHSSDQDLWHSTFDNRTFALKCTRCEKIVNNPDLSPRWSIHRLGIYVTPHRYCSSEGCKRGGKTMPVDNSVSFTWSQIETISQSPVRPSQQILRLFTALSRNRRPPRSSSYSICWCFRCRELTRLKDNESKYIDLAPRWTLGSALYVEHTGTYYRCRELRGTSATRRIPIQNIPSVQTTNLRDFYKRYPELSRSF